MIAKLSRRPEFGAFETERRNLRAPLIAQVRDGARWLTPNRKDVKLVQNECPSILPTEYQV
jgi:hypothetical protein